MGAEQVSQEMTLWAAIDAQRARVADLFDSLPAERWQHPSLCAGWSVREVGAHLTLQSQSRRQVLGSALRYPGSINRVIRRSAQQQARRLAPAEIVAAQRALIGRHVPNAFVTVRETLVDVLIHGLDVARPLGLPLEIPPQAGVVALDALVAYRGTSKAAVFDAVPGAMSGDDVRFVALDADWSTGEGRPVEASVADLLLRLSGRALAV